eukprot:8007393-Prorocentrum_lima.AAC.1
MCTAIQEIGYRAAIQEALFRATFSGGETRERTLLVRREDEFGAGKHDGRVHINDNVAGDSRILAALLMSALTQSCVLSRP